MALSFALGQQIAEAQFTHVEMKSHLFNCFEDQRLTHFPKPGQKERIAFTEKDSKFEFRVPKL